VPNLPDALIVSAQGGDQAALASLLAAAQPDIRRYARGVCKTADVDDAVQDAMCILHRRIGTLRAVSAFSSWVFAVVRRECIRLAKRGFGASTPLEAIADDARFALRPEVELRIDLAAALQSLPDHYRQVILMRDVREMTIGEIADVLQTTRETVKARLRRGRSLVGEYLG